MGKKMTEYVQKNWPMLLAVLFCAIFMLTIAVEFRGAAVRLLLPFTFLVGGGYLVWTLILALKKGQ